MISALSERPRVSVVVPMLDEAGFIGPCVDGFAAQTYPTNRMEVIVVDGGSSDGSRAVVERLCSEFRWLRVIDNPDRRAACAFNRGVEAAEGEVVCLFSGHGVPDPSYLEASVEALRRTDAAGVGGRYLHEGLDRTSNAIGLAMASRFGMASPQRFARHRRDVDTISHPAYRRTALLDVGPFDETLERNSDYELNWRLRKNGHRLVFDPSIVSVYRPRGSLRALARQFWWYGRWKAKVIQRDPASMRVRHLAAPVAVVVAALVPLAIPIPEGRRIARWLSLAYGAVIAAAIFDERPWAHEASSMVFGAAIPVMHSAWGAGFLVTLAQGKAAGG